MQPERRVALLAVHFDNGYFSRVGDGPMVEKPMNENPGATSGVHAVKYHKTIIAWGAFARRPLVQPIEIVPLAHQILLAGQPLRVQALLGGKPVEGIRLSLGEHGMPAFTAANVRTTSLSHEYLLAFPVHE